MKKLMMAAALAAFCGAVQADGITSANTVGYSGQSVVAGQWYMVGVQFADVSSAMETVDLNTLITTTCTPGEIGDGEDDTWGCQAPGLGCHFVGGVRSGRMKGL